MHRLDPEEKEAEKALAARIIQGDEKAFEAFLKKYEARLFSFALRMCGQRQDAEDTVQDVFFNALKALPGFRHEVPLLNWLFRIAAHRCGRMRRLKSGQPKHFESLQQARSGDETPRQLRANGVDALETLDKKQQDELLKRAVLALPSELRLVLVLRDLEELPADEVGRILGLSVAAVKSRLHRARLKLRQIWQKKEGR